MASIRFRKFLLLGLLMAVPIIAQGRQVIFLLDSQEVKEEGQAEDGASLEQALVPEDSDEWDEFQDAEDGTDDEFNPGSWRRVLEESRGRENLSEAEHWYVSGVGKMMEAVTRDQPELMNEAMADLQQAVDSGHPHAQSTLGFLYGVGSGVEQSDAKAFLYHYFAAQGGNYQSKMAVAYSFYRQQMLDKAVDLYADLASIAVASFFSSKETPLVDPIRIYDGTEENKEGLKKSRGEDDDDFQIIEYQAHKGNALAMNKLGLFYYLGLRGVPRDHAKALSWFLKAVDKGEYESMELIGEIYARGFGVQRNYTKALNWFRAALKQKHVSAYNGVGYLYAKGYGVDEKNFTRARECFKRAADAGDPNGHYNLGVLYLKGLGVSKDVKFALKHFIDAANSGHPKALYQLAKMFHKGVGLKKDLSNAVNLYKIVAERGPWGSLLRWALECYLKGQTAQALLLYSRAAELGYEIAQSNAAWILEKYGRYDICIGKSGYCSDVECHQRAHTLWWRASEQGNEQAALLIGDAYYYGRGGTDKDFERAAEAYRHAHSQANAQAMFNLGYMYEHGEGLPYDLHLAKRYYDQTLETDPAAKLPVKLALLSVWIRMNYADTFLVKALDSLPELVPRLGDWLKKTLLDEGNITLVTLFVCLLTVLYLRERQRRIAVQVRAEDEAENN